MAEGGKEQQNSVVVVTSGFEISLGFIYPFIFLISNNVLYQQNVLKERERERDLRIENFLKWN